MCIPLTGAKKQQPHTRINSSWQRKFKIFQRTSLGQTNQNQSQLQNLARGRTNFIWEKKNTLNANYKETNSCMGLWCRVFWQIPNLKGTHRFVLHGYNFAIIYHGSKLLNHSFNFAIFFHWWQLFFTGVIFYHFSTAVSEIFNWLHQVFTEGKPKIFTACHIFCMEKNTDYMLSTTIKTFLCPLEVLESSHGGSNGV